MKPLLFIVILLSLIGCHPSVGYLEAPIDTTHTQPHTQPPVPQFENNLVGFSFDMTVDQFIKQCEKSTINFGDSTNGVIDQDNNKHIAVISSNNETGICKHSDNLARSFRVLKHIPIDYLIVHFTKDHIDQISFLNIGSPVDKFLNQFTSTLTNKYGPIQTINVEENANDDEICRIKQYTYNQYLNNNSVVISYKIYKNCGYIYFSTLIKTGYLDKFEITFTKLQN